MANGTTWVGMDAHKRSISVAVLPPGSRDPIEWQVLNRTDDIRRLGRKLVRMAEGGEVRCCYEAGPCGFALKREFEGAAPLVCEVIALADPDPPGRAGEDRSPGRAQAGAVAAGGRTCCPGVSRNPRSSRRSLRSPFGLR
jgi:hypothetical protein